MCERVRACRRCLQVLTKDKVPGPTIHNCQKAYIMFTDMVVEYGWGKKAWLCPFRQFNEVASNFLSFRNEAHHLAWWHTQIQTHGWKGEEYQPHSVRRLHNDICTLLQLTCCCTSDTFSEEVAPSCRQVALWVQWEATRLPRRRESIVFSRVDGLACT